MMLPTSEPKAHANNRGKINKLYKGVHEAVCTEWTVYEITYFCDKFSYACLDTSNRELQDISTFCDCIIF